MRTDADALAIRADFERGGRVAVVGAGFIGAEVAASARARGLDVSLIEALDAPMLAPLGDQLARFMADLHRDEGVDLRTGQRVSGWLGGERVEGLRLESGETIEASTVIVGVGVRPTVEWLADSGLSIGDGVICDQFVRAAPGVFAAGDGRALAQRESASVRLLSAAAHDARRALDRMRSSRAPPRPRTCSPKPVARS